MLLPLEDPAVKTEDLPCDTFRGDQIHDEADHVVRVREPLQRTVLKNQINRLTGGTAPTAEGEGGNLYSVEELAFVKAQAAVEVSVYVKARDAAWAGRAQEPAMLAATDYLAKRAGDGPLFLCMMFHTNEATAGASPYHATTEAVERFLGQLEAYLDALRARFEIEPIGLSEAAAVPA